MDFNRSCEPVTLLNFTPLLDSLEYAGTFASNDVIMAMDIAAPPTPMTISQGLQYDRYQENNFCSDPGFLSSQAASPALSGTTSGYDDSFDLDSIEEVLSKDPIADLGGPVPIRTLHRMDDEPPRKKETAYAPLRNRISYSGTRSNPHSPVGDMRRRAHAENRSRTRFTSKSSVKVVRANSPMFPDHSTPLSSITQYPSTNSLNYQDSTFSSQHSVISDPGPVYCKGMHQYKDSAVNSPAAVSLQEYPARFEFQTPTTVQPPSCSTNSKSCMELEIPMKYVRKIVDLDKKILKLQAERSKVLEKAHHTKSNPAVTTDEEYWPTESKLPGSSELGKVHLYIFPLGIHQLDEPLYEDANQILRHVGGLYFDLQQAIANLKNICYKGVYAPDISTCFAYIKSLLPEKQNLKISSSDKETSVYQIVLDIESGSSNVANPQEFLEALNAANDVLQYAQHISHSYTHVQSQLLKVKQIAAEKMEQSDKICQKLGIMDREKRSQIRSVLEGNCATMASAGRVWPQYYQFATDTIKTITECIHPTQ